MSCDPSGWDRGVLLPRCRTDATLETVRGEAAAGGLWGYPPCAPANLKAGRVSDGWMALGVLCFPWPSAGRAVGCSRWSGVFGLKNEFVSFLEQFYQITRSLLWVGADYIRPQDTNQSYGRSGRVIPAPTGDGISNFENCSRIISAQHGAARGRSDTRTPL